MVAVHVAGERQLEDSNRVNISGIAATTGISRAEVSRILSSGRSSAGATKRQQNVTTKILSAWHRDAPFLTFNNRPRDLKIFGSGPTFESLVRMHGQGIPTRAILDELIRIGAIQSLTSSQKIRSRMSLAVNPRTSCKKIKEFDDAVRKIFSCLRDTKTPAKLAKRPAKSRRNLRRNR